MTNPQEQLDAAARNADSLEKAANVLSTLLGGGYSIWEDGSLYFIRQLVARVDGLRIEIFPREHPPPHFHVSAGKIDAVFSIQDGSYIEGRINGRNKALVGWWYERSRPLLIKVWNNTRPSDCPVGEIAE